MAQGSIVIGFDLALSDVDRGVYEALSFKVAQHPSETAVYLVTRVLAYALEHAEGIEFAQGLATGDVPALSVRDLFGSDVQAQQAAAAMLQKAAFDEPDAAQLPLVDKALANTALDAKARTSLERARAAMQLASDDEAQRLAAAQALGGMGDPVLKPLLAARLEHLS